MNSSREELIELTELKSPFIENSRKFNKIDGAISVTSVSTANSEESNIKNIFSVTPRKQNDTNPASPDRQTVSEISDEVFMVGPSTSKTSESRKTYKQKISEHIRKIKERTSTPLFQGISNKGRVPLERIRKETRNLDAEVDNVRTIFKLGDNDQERSNFFNFDAPEQVEHIDENELFSYSLPERMIFNIDSSAKEHLFIPKRGISAKTHDDLGKTENSKEKKIPSISLQQMNLLEQRLLGVNDSKWFDNSGNIIFLEDPVYSYFFKPNRSEPYSRCVTYRVPNLLEECSEIVVIENKIMDIYLSKLKFSHHPLFSIENVLVEYVKSLFDQYKSSRHRNTVGKLKTQLEALRVERDKISGGGDNKNFEDINKEITRIREKYFEETEREKTTVKRILETWKLVRNIREKQQYSNTSLTLFIRKEKVDEVTEQESYKKMFENTLEEIVREYNNEDNVKVDESVSENNDSNQNKMPDIEDIRKKLQDRFQNSFKSLGVPDLSITLSENNEISQEITNPKEVIRRNVINTTKFYLRILCNNIEACKTKFLSLNYDFSVDIDETFCLQLNEVPKYLQIEIYEQPKSLLKKKIADISINIPGTKSNKKLNIKNFDKNEIVHYKHEGVGSGSNLKIAIEKFGIKSLDDMDIELKTAGYLEYSIEWEKSAKREENTELITKLNFLNEIIDKNFVVDESKLKPFLHSGEISTNEDIMQNAQASKHFRLNPHQNSLNFCDIQEIEENVRLKILQLRDQKEIEFDGIPIPNRVKEIPFNVLNDYKRRKITEERGFQFEEFDEEDVETQRKLGKKFLKQIYIRTFQMCKNTANNLDYDSVLDERYLIYFHLMVKTLLRNLLNWFRWRPKITKPLPMLEKKNDDGKHEEASKISSNIVVYLNIISAKNIPNRLEKTFNKTAESVGNEVQPFVRVGYKNLTARTTTGKGPNPVWNEILTLPLQSTNTDYLSPNSLHGNISVNIFDESDIEIKKLDKKCINWLGGFNISVSAICSSNMMNGFFKIKLPHILLGYTTEEERQNSNKTNKFPNIPSHHSYLEMEIYVEPLIPRLSPNMEELASGDIPYIHDHILMWNKKYNQRYPHRKFNALTLDVNGKATCVTRFITALEPPQINLDEFDVTIEQCLRYVSLIPYTDCNQFYNCVWLSTDQLINLMIGSIIDHAIALTCYLSALKVDVWLLLGYGIPHGNAAFVLLREHNSDAGSPLYYILDVLYEEKYNIIDEYSPLQHVFCVINSNNVWANIQGTDDIKLTKFDLSRKSDWLPLFDNSGPTAPSNVICNRLIYKSKQETDLIEMQLERHLKRQLMKLRQLDRTIWNAGVSSVLTNVLKSLEMNCMFHKTNYETTEIQSEISPYTVSGFMFNVPFTSMFSIIKKIKSLGIHLQEEDDVEFAISVYIHSYPGMMMSVWICIASVKNNE